MGNEFVPVADSVEQNKLLFMVHTRNLEKNRLCE